MSSLSIPQFIGTYTIEGRLGSGGMADVFLARPPVGFRAAAKHPKVALKTLLPRFARDDQFRAMFEEEAQIGTQLHHPNIVELIDFGTTNENQLFLVMEWIDGVDLGAVLSLCREQKLRLKPPLGCYIVEQTLRGLHAAHTRTDRVGQRCPVVHRDVSPVNILIGVDGCVKITDFGLSRPMERARRTLPGMIKGKLSYLSPEQTYDRPVDPRTDVFAAGTVLYEVLTSQRLFAHDDDLHTILAIREAKIPNLAQFAPDVDSYTTQVLQKALQVDPANRFQSAEDFANALLECIRQTPTDILRAMIIELVREVQKSGAISTQPITLDSNLP